MNNLEYIYIDKQPELDELTSKMATSSYIGLDTEGDSLHCYFEKVCLIQITIEAGNFIVDPLAGLDMKGFVEAIENGYVILHGGDYDLRMLHKDFHFQPKGKLMDTQIAASFAGISKTGITAILDELLGIEHQKDQQLSDWSKRPLTEEQLTYAVTDTAYLKPLNDKLIEILESQGKLRWFKQTMKRIVAQVGNAKAKEIVDPWRVKGYIVLQSSELRFLREIWNWREEVAKQLDRPPFKVMPNSRMIDLAKLLDANPNIDLSGNRLIPKCCKGNFYEMLLEYISKARKLRRPDWPAKYLPKKEFEPDDKALTKKLRDFVAEVASEKGLEPCMLVKRTKLEAVSRDKPENKRQLKKTLNILEWQEEILCDGLMDIIKNHQ